MTEGPLDNYFDSGMSEEEKAYFNSRGSEHAEEKVAETINVDNESTDSDGGEPGGLLEDETQSASDDAVGEQSGTDTADDDGDDSSDLSSMDDEESETEKHTKSDRNYEKAFKTERHKRKELREALEAQARKTAEMEATLNQLRQSMQQQNQPRIETPPVKQEIAPDADEDPLGYMQYQIRQQERVIAEHNKYLQERHEYEKRHAQEAAFKQAYANSAKEFSKKQADFIEAYNYLTESKIKEYVAAGFTQEQANGFLIEDEMAIVTKAYNDKVNPAERIYGLAKARGYAAGSTPKKAVAAKNLSDLKKGIANSKSLRSGGGQPTEREPGIDDIDSMNFDEFDTYWAKLKASSKGMG